MEKVSAIVAIYKSEAFLPKLIDSIISQTWENLEILLIDDGSPDNSGAICDEYAKRDNRIRVIHKKNGGACAARNTGLSLRRTVSIFPPRSWDRTQEKRSRRNPPVRMW